MAQDRGAKTGLSGMFGLLGGGKNDTGNGRTSEQQARRTSEAARAESDPFERMERPARDIVRLMADAPVFADLSERDRATIADLAHVARCHGGTSLWNAGDRAHWLVVVVQGRIESRANLLPGVEHPVRVSIPGDVIGIEAIFGAELYHHGCFATERTAVLRIPIVEVRRALELGRPAAIKLYVAIAAALGAQVREATVEVVRLLEKTSIMPARGVGISDGALNDLLNQKP